MITLIQSTLIIVLIILVFAMMLQIQSLNGTARVVNYAGLVRGATQREVKLEICGKESDKMIQYLDDVLHGLKSENGKYDLVKLPDDAYQQLLDLQIERWKDLKQEIYKVRKQGDYKKTNILEISEDYFNYADRTVTASEKYSEKVATHIRYTEYASAFVMLVLIMLVISQYLYAIKIARNNRILKQKAYLDVHTGLPNKSRCEELLRNTGFLSDKVGFILLMRSNTLMEQANIHRSVLLMVIPYLLIMQSVHFVHCLIKRITTCISIRKRSNINYKTSFFYPHFSLFIHNRLG